MEIHLGVDSFNNKIVAFFSSKDLSALDSIFPIHNCVLGDGKISLFKIRRDHHLFLIPIIFELLNYSFCIM